MNPTRRRLIAAVPLAGAALAADGAGDRPAILGGGKAHPGPFPSWPVIDQAEERAILDALRSGKWFRGDGKRVAIFEEAYARLTGAKTCLATANGTSALDTSLNAMGIGPGDEVIVPPYTFVATVNAVLRQHALPVFVDTDPETFQMDARKLEAAITPQTRAIIPVHLGGNVCDLDAILRVAARRQVPVLEDACQAHLAEWRGRKVGTLGLAGCFSFQASKNLNSGEGGAILTDDLDLRERCYAFHNNGRGQRSAGSNFSYLAAGCNLRMTEFQAALLLAQMARIEAQAGTRSENAQYLNANLKEIPGIFPARMYDGCTRNAYHLYMFRYSSEHFAGLPRPAFLKALAAEGVPASGGYRPLNTQPFLRSVLHSRGYGRIYSAREIAGWEERNRCPANDRLCEEAVWFVQTMLLAPRESMEGIVAAIRKIQRHAREVAKAMAGAG
jgi:dTDP-4-amino-4,6-dideoxygalactose transaminase